MISDSEQNPMITVFFFIVPYFKIFYIYYFQFTAVLLFIKKSTRELILSTLPHLLTADTNRTDPFHALPIGFELSEAVLKAVGEAAYFDSNGIRSCAKVSII